ncbi:menaquinol oxidoreductase [Geoalkalibacter sp.]|uniref:menaquinol oxidoreductase n=1 Tax=Geoalkalibacter sp. TaxID=3041440 RepID=UPI00272EA188|nr:menaquinol oxidoreductase [Geoalkalibacter sp.]
MGLLRKSRRSPEAPERAGTATAKAGRERIRQLHALSHRGLWGLAAFLAVSLVAFNHSRLLPPLSDNLRAVLGKSPPTNLISIALVVYSFSALVLILSRMSTGQGKYKGWSHLAYLSAFYVFYLYGNVLDANFWAVFAAGVTIMALEHYQLWTFCTEAIRKEEERLAQAERLEKFKS